MTPDDYDLAACKGQPTALFFPTGTPQTLRQHRAYVAARFCSHCPVRQSCQDAGRGEYGLWGGELGGGERAAANAARQYQWRVREAKKRSDEKLARLVTDYGMTQVHAPSDPQARQVTM